MLGFWRNLIDAGLFAAEVQGVIALRLMRLASGGSEASAEIRRMVNHRALRSSRSRHISVPQWQQSSTNYE